MNPIGDKKVEKVLKKRIKNEKVEYYVKWIGYSGRFNKWEKDEDLNGEDRDRILAFEKQRAINVLGIARKDSALAYLIQFNDAHEPVFVNCADARVWSELIFDFLMDKHKYEGLTSDVGGMTINILGATADVNGRPEVIYVTDVMGDTNFLLKFENGFQFVTAQNVKANFAEMAVDYLEKNLKLE